MPIPDDIMEHKVLGREYKRGLLEGELRIVQIQLERRFGQVPTWAELRLRQMTTHELENLAECVLQVHSLEQLLP